MIITLKMMHTQPVLRRRLSAANVVFPSASPIPFSHYLKFPFRPTNHYSLCSAHNTWIAQLPEELAVAAAAAAPPPNEGPIELPSSIPSIISAAYSSTSLQTAASVLLTGAFSIFLFRSLRRRAKRAKEARIRSSGAIGSFKTASKPLRKRTSPDQAFLGAVIAAACGILLYKFTTSVEYSLNNQALSNNYSVRQITITIRTIINGMCYLATFVFGFNSLGLFLYSGQLAINSFAEVSRSQGDAPLNSSYPKSSDADSSGITSVDEDQSSDKNTKMKKTSKKEME